MNLASQQQSDSAAPPLPATPPPGRLRARPVGMSSTRRRILGLVGLLLLVLLTGVASIAIGAKTISLDTTWQALINFDPGSSDHLLVRVLRIPRTLLAVLVGCALGAAGAIMQAVTRNPLADPGLLGVNAGAAAAIAIAIAVFGITNTLGYMWFGLLGATLAGAAVVFLGGALTGTNPVRLVLAGAALSVVLLAITQVVLVNTDESVFDAYRHWVVGSLQGRGFDVLLPVCGLVACGLLLALGLASSLNAVALGKDLSQTLGARPVRTFLLAAITVVVLAGGATAAAGPVAFVGLTAPHVARLLVGPDHRWLLPYAMVLSAALVLLADTLGRVIARPGEVSVGIAVALIGGPFFVALVRRKKLVQL